MDEEANELDGLWGWLLVFTGFVVFTIIRVSLAIASAFWPLFRDGMWQGLTTPDSPAYNPMWQHLIVFELVGNIVIVAMATLALALLVVRSSYAPKFAIVFLLTSLAVVAAGYFIAGQIPAVAGQGTDYESLAELFRSFMAMLIWVPYFLLSKRVKATFANRLPTEPSP